MRTKAPIPTSLQKRKELSDLRKENRKLRSQVKRLQSDKAIIKEKLDELKSKIPPQKQPIAATLPSDENIPRHQYSELLVSICVNMYVLGGCGLRSVIRLISYLNTTLQWGLTELPCKSSVENWVLKAGYHIYETAAGEQSGKQDYGIIVDECMIVGQERLLAALCAYRQKRWAAKL